MLRLIGRKSSSNVQKVLWCLDEIGLPYERTDLGGRFGGNDQPDYLALNPNGLVPTLDDDGFILWESNVIVRYLCAKHALGRFCPVDLRERFDCERWMDWQQTTARPPTAVIFRKYLIDPPMDLPAAQVEAAVAEAARAWNTLDRHLATRPYVGGPSLTMADFAFGNSVHRWFTAAIERPSQPALRDWYDRLCARPAYRAAFIER